MTAATLLALRQDGDFELRDFEARADVWWAAPGGHVADDDAPPGSGRVLFDGDLGLGEPAGIAMVSVGHRFLRPGAEAEVELHGRLAYWLGRWDGERSLDTNEVFDGATFAAGSRIDSELKFDFVSLEMEAFLGESDAPFRPGFLAGVHLLRIAIRAEDGAASESRAYGDLGWRLGFVGEARPHESLFGRFQLSLGSGLLDALFFETSITAGVETGPFRIEAGWRTLRFENNSDSDDELRLSLGGPTFSVTVRF